MTNKTMDDGAHCMSQICRQTADPDTWTFLDEGNFVISKHDVPFTAIDPDHAIKHEHRKMIVKGGFLGITGNE